MGRTKMLAVAISSTVVSVTDTATFATKNEAKIVIAKTTHDLRAARMEKTRSNLVGKTR